MFICAPPGVFGGSDLRELVADLNTHVSPFYRWQSSGLVNLSFTEGSVITPGVSWDVVWPPGLPFGTVRKDHWGYAFHPPQCAPSSGSQSGANGYLIYVYNIAGDETGYGVHTRVDGRGVPDQSIAIVYIGDRYRREGLNNDRYRDVAGHELDHSHLWIWHLTPPIGSDPSQSFGPTRAPFAASLFNPYELFDLQSFLEEWKGRGLRQGPGIPQYFAVEGDRENVPPGMDRVLTCHDRERLGWPVGAETPPCVRIAPPPPRVSLHSGNDRRFEVEIDPPYFYSDNTARTGYIIELSEWTKSRATDGRELKLVARYVVGPDTRRYPLTDVELRKTYHLAVYPYSEYGISYRTYSTHNVIREFAQKFPPVSVEVQDRSLTRDQLLASQPGRGPDDIRLEDGLRFRLSWTAPEGASGYRLTGFGRYRTTVTASGQRRTATLSQSAPEIILDGAAHGLEFNTSYTIAIQACGEFPGVSNSLGRCHDHAEISFRTPTVLPSVPHTPPEAPVFDDYDYRFRRTYPFPPASPRFEDRSLTLQQLLQNSPGQSAETVRQADGLRYRLSWTAPANVVSYDWIGFGNFRFRRVDRNTISAAWGGSRGSNVPELVLDGREHQLEFDYTYNIIIRACFEIEDNDDNPRTRMLECHDFAEVSLTTRSSLSQ